MIQAVGNIVRGFVQYFMYFCLIPFLSIIFAKRNEFLVDDTSTKYKDEYIEVIRMLKISIIMITVKIVFDVHSQITSTIVMDNLH